ncbi:zinc ribbon domain-containing protein [Deinococcus sp. NW-56]|uniref:zinc ribbon domain-containing protein n=1 Tax=Deinococcus sp. NW-56 TaxID=2080419 RepID=UPI00131A36BF
MHLCPSAGRAVVRVDPRFTSQACSQCGHTCRENRVSQSRFVCQSRGHTANADHNAALNIHAFTEKPRNESRGVGHSRP